ncbi:hypothetical protein Vadar_011213 [Vaccinium darrowii]|uniref:Uncharacterized protein n=1 Tax=Vaccinium darrowii TaxID=229202 RepID=A0ACB7XQS1_9ERIC|nr:hypothetical protein Vadar_011213 [Vaccinium darrowii]
MNAASKETVLNWKDGESRGIEFKPHVVSLSVSDNNGFAQDRGFKVGARNAVVDFGIIGNHRSLDLLANTVVLDGLRAASTSGSFGISLAMTPSVGLFIFRFELDWKSTFEIIRSLVAVA